jgi:hypothetical protein
VTRSWRRCAIWLQRAARRARQSEMIATSAITTSTATTAV